MNPLSCYGLRKYCAETYVEFSGLRSAILRPVNVYGPRQRAALKVGWWPSSLNAWTGALRWTPLSR